MFFHKALVTGNVDEANAYFAEIEIGKTNVDW